MSIWFTSDRHFGHDNIINFCNRPVSNAEEMDELLIKNYNAVVGKNHTVYDLGDFSWHRSEAKNLEIFNRLNGRKHLIVGNHDPEHILKLPWESVSYIKEVRVQKQRIVLCHYPMREWHGFYHGSYHLFGHVHNQLPKYKRSMDVGVDTNSTMTPYNIEDVFAILESERNT